MTRASEQLSLGQPAMSAALARLRRHFDDPLLVRDGRTYRLSTFAESLLEPVRDAMTALVAATDRPTTFDPATDARSFTVATSDYAALVFMRPLLAQLAREAPGVRLRQFVAVAGEMPSLIDVRLREHDVELRVDAIGPIVEAMYWSPRSAEDSAHRWLRSRFVTHAQRV